MSQLFLGAFYDSVNLSVGPTLTYTFFFLMLIELLYVSFKYTSPFDDKEKS
ncbi:MAG: hypothetical protein KF744_08465 [Taibaiella sp.]|jgi:hypothetical protein|nr:hypothetical protein [Taibaiella sp.]